MASCGGGPAEPRVLDLASDGDALVLAADAQDFLTFRSGLATGDLNGDGLTDLVLGASRGDGPGNARRDAGEVHVVFGAVATGSLVDLASAGGTLVVFGAVPGDQAGSAVAVGDVDGDGANDLVIGVPLADGRPGASRSSGGAVVVLRGPLSPGVVDLATTAPDLIVHGARAGDRLGDALAVGDLDGDGRDDIAAAAPGADGPIGGRSGAGAVVVVLGAPLVGASLRDLAASPPDFAVHGESAGDALGVAIAVGDLTGDGQADLVVSTTGSGGLGDARPQSGEVHVVFGPLAAGAMRDLAVEAADASVHGADAGDLLGQSVAVAAGGLQAGALVLGAPNGSGPGNGRFRCGEVHVVLGPLSPGLVLDLAATSADVEVRGAREGDFLGWFVGAGDLDGDGVVDVIGSALGQDGSDAPRPSAGAAYALSGPFASGLVVDLSEDATALAVLGSSPGEQLGSALATGDVSGDGVDDLVLASRTADGTGGSRPGSGLAHVVFGVAGSCTGELELVGVPEDATVACGEVPPPAAVDVLDPCDPEPVLTFSEVSLPGACGNERVLERTWTAENHCGSQVAATQRIFVVDLSAPEVGASDADVATLWPPDHRMVRFTTADFAPAIADACGGATTWRFVDCAPDQDDGAAEADCVVEDGGQAFQVRAERSGSTLASRHYAVTVTAVDDCGNESAPTVIGRVSVGHDRGDALQPPAPSADLLGGGRLRRAGPAR